MAPKRCANRECRRQKAPDGSGLRTCAKCNTAAYCGKSCQATHWPTHRGLCPESKHKFPHRGYNLLQTVGEDEAGYGKIIDTFRPRVEDDYAFGGENHGIYGMANLMPCFEDFLDRAEATDQLLPWWGPDKRAKCVQIALTSEDSRREHAVEKPDIQEFCKDNSMPMQLRMMAENIYGGGYGLGQYPMPAGYQCYC